MAIIKTAVVNGTPHLAPVGSNSFTALGNTTKLTAAHAVDKKTLPNLQGGGGNDDSFEKLNSATLSMSCRHVSIALLAMAFGGTVSAVNSGAVADEPHTVVALDTLIMLDSMQDMSVALVVKDTTGTTTYIEGTDYVRKRAGFIPLASGAITAAEDLKVSYTRSVHQRVQALLNTSTERGFLFDGINERTGKPWSYLYHRVNWGVAKNIELIGEDYISFDVEGEVLAYDGITDPAKSKFYEVLIGDAL